MLNYKLGNLDYSLTLFFSFVVQDLSDEESQSQLITYQSERLEYESAAKVFYLYYFYFVLN